MVQKRAPTDKNAKRLLESGDRETAIVGEYSAASQRFFRAGNTSEKMNILADHGVLYTQFGNGKRLQLVPVNEQHFRRPYQPEATIAILQTDTHIVIQGDFGNYQKPIRDLSH